MSKKDHLDRFFTPEWYAVGVRRRVGELSCLLGGSMFDNRFGRVLEPSCGAGAYVDACHAAGDKEVWGCDIDDQATGLQRCDIARQGDWREWAAELKADGVHFDLAIGNPPFGGPAIGRGRNPGDPAYLGAVHVSLAISMSTMSVFTLPWSWRCTKGPMEIFPRPPTFIIPTPRPFAELRELAVWVWLDPQVVSVAEYTTILPWLEFA